MTISKGGVCAARSTSTVPIVLLEAHSSSRSMEHGMHGKRQSQISSIHPSRLTGVTAFQDLCRPTALRWLSDHAKDPRGPDARADQRRAPGEMARIVGNDGRQRCR